jgi:hypothetical protein
MAKNMIKGLIEMSVKTQDEAIPPINARIKTKEKSS